MLRDTESKFLDNISITSRGMVKTASSQLPGDKERIQKILKSFGHSPDVPTDIMGKFLQRAELDLDSESVKQDFFIEMKAMRQKDSLHIVTAKSLRRAGIFKIAGRDVYEDLETGDFWKISEDKKHVMRLFKEDDTGIADKSASSFNTYTVMGSTPGDGGVIKAKSFDEAITQFWLQDVDLADHTAVKKQIAKELKERPGKKISDSEVHYGDYEVKLTSGKGAGKKKGPGIPDGTGPMRGTPQCPYYKGKEEKEDDNEKEDGTGPMRRRLRHKRRQPFSDKAENEKENKASANGKKVEAKEFEDFDRLKKMISDVIKIISSKKFKDYLKNLDIAHGVKTKDVASEILTGLNKFELLDSMIEGLKKW
jgi:ribosomal protein S18